MCILGNYIENRRLCRIWRDNGAMVNGSRPGGTRLRAVVWLLVVAALGVAIGVWGATLAGVVGVRSPSVVATPTTNFGVRFPFDSSATRGTLVTIQSDCIYGQSSEGMLIVLCAKTGSLLSPLQTGHCTK